ncbi:hypothetical protein KUCAC02_030665 [Chaenocephalus aceratus]|uniref:Uncharacterized protein n=1 Tax=Chaenocephalus aceratus TaxID=36190 RepID=A0ACB9XLU2_CHAAC|nr:hypothetical protein KUCAC02_030665 [Chaenocephalus aceratus]
MSTRLGFLQSHLGPQSQGLHGSTQFIAAERSTSGLSPVLMTPDPEHILWSGCSAVLWRNLLTWQAGWRTAGGWVLLGSADTP